MKKDVNTFIQEHTHYNYCECVIDKDGLIEYAVPSHVETLIRYTGKTRDQISDDMPLSASPLHWLTEKTGCVAVYTKGYLAKNMNTDQLSSLWELIKAKLTTNNNFY